MDPQLLSDALLIATGTLPNSSQTTSTSFLDIGNGGLDQFLPKNSQFNVTIPALTGTQLPTSATFNVRITSSPDASTLITEIPVLATISGSSLANTLNIPFRTRMGVNRYLRADFISGNALALPGTLTGTLSIQF